MERKVAFVLGGGGHAGAAEVGMLHALLERGVRPEIDLRLASDLLSVARETRGIV